MEYFDKNADTPELREAMMKEIKTKPLWRVFIPRNKQIIRYLKPDCESKDILEIGCGRGAGARLISEEFEPNRLVLLDLDMQMIRKARDYAGVNNDRNLFYCRASATYLPFHNSTFDAIFGFGFLHHVLKWQNSITEIVRVLRPGGIYYLMELYPALYQNFLTRRLLVHPEKNRFNSADLRKTMVAEGLELAHSLEINKIGILAIGTKNVQRI